uniref:NADH-ubiquinone oxidoreductase chain 3 n=1 Tax=Paurocephala sauteri TaxID=2768670 RepID=A0A7L9R557_9HEMI|nr:NADH dehydrogenase subunit 3 [Paurocephala sauteri]QOL10533.1 NADH dehydrogenase subunit 3 [Paurocephala sauteri]
MTIIALIMIFFFIILMIIMNILPLINNHKFKDREKASPFECGFDPFMTNRINFSIHFFIISLMFLIFDIEITLILPLPILFHMMNFNSWLMMTLTLLILLIIGLILEWKENSMEWK